MNKNNFFSIIVTTKNRYDMLIDILNCLVNQDYKNFNVYIVDDNSHDNTKNINLDVYNKYFYCKIFHSTINLNMIKARNCGLLMANQNSDFFVILDDDNKFANDFLLRFNDFFNKYNNKHLVQPKNYNKDGLTICHFGLNYNLSNLLPKAIKKEFNKDYIKVDSIANCLFISNELIKKNKYFMEDYVIDFSETEFCFRALKNGYNTYVANIPIMHQSTNGVDFYEGYKIRIDTRPETYFYTFRNKYLIVDRFGNFFNKLSFIIFWQFFTLCGYTYISLFKVKRIKLFKLYFLGFLAGNYYFIFKKLKKYHD